MDVLSNRCLMLSLTIRSQGHESGRKSPRATKIDAQTSQSSVRSPLFARQAVIGRIIR